MLHTSLAKVRLELEILEAQLCTGIDIQTVNAVQLEIQLGVDERTGDLELRKAHGNLES